MEPEQLNTSVSDSTPPDGSGINRLVVLQPGERVICNIKRHPIGLVGIYFSAVIVVVAVIAGAIAAPSLLPNLSQQLKMAATLVAAIILGITLLYTYIASMIYNANRWIVTSDSITQVTQSSLFARQTSQLSLANLEDVTVDQGSVFQSMFGYGTLRAESAGARGKFFFAYCPQPEKYARLLIEAHEEYIAHKPEETMVANRSLANTASFNQPH